MTVSGGSANPSRRYLQRALLITATPQLVAPCRTHCCRTALHDCSTFVVVLLLWTMRLILVEAFFFFLFLGTVGFDVGTTEHGRRRRRGGPRTAGLPPAAGHLPSASSLLAERVSFQRSMPNVWHVSLRSSVPKFVLDIKFAMKEHMTTNSA